MAWVWAVTTAMPPRQLCLFPLLASTVQVLVVLVLQSALQFYMEAAP
jgi:hypothetical protein